MNAAQRTSPKPLTNRERVAEILRKGIYFGTFQPGQELVQNTIAQQLGVSRMPVREAIYILLNEGLVEHIPNRGFFVKNVGRAFFEDYFFIRVLFEQRAVDYICRHWTDPAPLEALQEEEQEAYRKRDIPALSALTNRLQDYMQENCGSPRLSAYLDLLLRMSPRRVSQSSQQRETFIDSTFQYHQNLISAILERDSAKASALIAEHTKRTQAHYFAIRDQLGLDG